MRVVRVQAHRWSGVGALLLGSLFALGLAPTGLAADASERVIDRTASAARPELGRELLVLTNADRAAGGRVELALEDRLSRYATLHSRRMARFGYLFHSGDRQLRGALEGSNWSVAGENVGVGETLAGVQDAFMASGPHRRNILGGAYDHAAIGVVESGGLVWVTVVFYGS